MSSRPTERVRERGESQQEREEERMARRQAGDLELVAAAPGSNPEEEMAPIMNSNSKGAKPFQEQHSEGTCEDRISSLPSGIVSDKILSLLPTKDSVATSVLSSRWKELWTMTTCLYFDDRYLRNPGENVVSSESLKAKFVNFVNRVLLLGRFARIERFLLHLKEIYDPLFLNAIIASVVKSNVQDLDLDLHMQHSAVLPRELFTCRTLVELKLGKRVLMNVPCRVSLPCVKDIQLYQVMFPDGDAITRFLSGCPVLDSLVMCRVVGKNVKLINISVPTLTFFEIEYIRLFRGDWDNLITGDETENPTLRIVLDAPLLETFIFQDFLPEGFTFKSPLHKLKLSRIHIGGPFGCNMKVQDTNCATASGLLRQLCNVENFSILCEDISRCVVPTFENLTELRYGHKNNLTLEMMLKLLEFTPKLHTFIAILGLVQEDSPGDLEPSRNIPYCCLSHLKVVKIADVIEPCKKLHIVDYFLRNAQVMEKLTIARMDTSTPAPNFLLNLLQRACSRACQIEIE